jgi:leader peptidase (prepilin peptidase) / N-methyltransferase
MTTAHYFAVAIAAGLCAVGARRDLGAHPLVVLAIYCAVCSCAWLLFGTALALTAAVGMVCLLIIETDRRLNLIPDTLVLAMLALSIATPFAGSPASSLIGAVVLGLTFLVVRQVGAARYGREAMGLGDVKLATAMGALLGPVPGFAAVAIGGAATLVTLIARGGNQAIPQGAPFGVGLAAATMAVAIVRTLAP